MQTSKPYRGQFRKAWMEVTWRRRLFIIVASLPFVAMLILLTAKERLAEAWDEIKEVW